MKRTNPLPQLSLLVVAAGALAGCASTTNPKPEIEAARALVTQADQSGAAEFAGADVQTAHDRLKLAEQANAANHDEEAERYAAEAGIKAKLALARASADKAERAAQESARGVEALRDAATRDAATRDADDSPPDTDAPTP